MKIVETGDKVNFVDEADVFVGYSLSQSCCEHADWMLSRVRPTELVAGVNGIDPDGYHFDTAFFDDEPSAAVKGGLDEGGVATFRLTKGTDEIFLTLWNSHNGYYGHGFEVKHGGTVVRNGCL